GVALLELATGGRPTVSTETENVSDPFEHPDAKRRFKLIGSSDELTRALEFPWDKWTVFLHPEQRGFVERNFNGPARVSGSAGTGKSIVALHRAYSLALKNPDSRILLSTFSDALASALQNNLNKLISTQPQVGERIEVLSLPALIKRLFQMHFGRMSFASEKEIKPIISSEKARTNTKDFSIHFLWKEWEHVVDAWQIQSWEQYRVVPRLGRKTRLTEENRKALWQVLSKVRDILADQGFVTESDACRRLESMFQDQKKTPYDFAIVDEAQDLSVPQIRLLAAMLSAKPNGLFFAGDLGQRIFQQPFSWTQLGVDIRGRSKTLKINYRTSQQIRRQSDRLLESRFTDVDGVTEDRSGTVSVFSGPPPILSRANSPTDECRIVGNWLRDQVSQGVLAQEICVIVRSEEELSRALDAISKAGYQSQHFESSNLDSPGHIAVATMHLAKGLEFRSVAVMACDDEIVPLQSRIETVGDDADLQEVYATERQLLYVACTRARENLLVTGVEPVSEFLDDFER
ncbi:MAG: 3'-5' exonuclease, partial [Planctomycetota bacterium]